MTLFTPKRVKNRSKTGSKWKINKKGLRNMKIGHKITKNTKKNKKKNLVRKKGFWGQNGVKTAENGFKMEN